MDSNEYERLNLDILMMQTVDHSLWDRAVWAYNHDSGEYTLYVNIFGRRIWADAFVFPIESGQEKAVWHGACGEDGSKTGAPVWQCNSDESFCDFRDALAVAGVPHIVIAQRFPREQEPEE